MKKQLLVGVFVSALIALPGFGQQSNSNNQAAPASQSSADREPLQPDTPKDFWDGDDPNLINLVTHPFANKKYVQRMTRPIKDRISELDGITAENQQHIRDIDSRSQQGLQLASEKTSLADQHANDAAGKAQMAQTAATQASTRVGTAEQMVANLDQFKGTSQTEILFRPGQSVLSKQAKDALDSMASPLKDQKSYIIEVKSYASGKGQAATASSQKMADSVVRYLVLSHNIPMYRIYALSMGNTPAEGTAKPIRGGRVEVNLLKNDVTAQR